MQTCADLFSFTTRVQRLRRPVAYRVREPLLNCENNKSRGRRNRADQDGCADKANSQLPCRQVGLLIIVKKKTFKLLRVLFYAIHCLLPVHAISASVCGHNEVLTKNHNTTTVLRLEFDYILYWWNQNKYIYKIFGWQITKVGNFQIYF